MPDTNSVLILGGGFAGWYTARRLAALLPRASKITVVDRVNHMLYTPMLTEVGGGTVASSAIAVQQRLIPKGITWENQEATAVNAQLRSVTLADGRILSAEHLVLALGAVTSYHNIPGARENSICFKTLADANYARLRVDEMVDQAARIPSGQDRRNRLTLVVAGGGYTGVETMAALYARLRTQAKSKGISSQDITAILVEPMSRLMQEMPEKLAAYGKRKLESDGIRVLTGTGVSKVENNVVTLTNGEEVTANLLVWDTGIEPAPLVSKIAVPKGKHRGVAVDTTFRVQGLSNVWSIGDCAEIPNEENGTTFAPTAQNAVREGTHLAKNIALSLQGKNPQPFRYKMLGELALISEHSAIANILGIQISGFVAWIMWWIIYTAKLPGLSNRLQVIKDRL